MASQPSHRDRTITRRARPALGLLDLLVEVGHGPTRLDLVCWQLNVDEPQVRPAWDVARRVQFIDTTGADALTGHAPLYALTDRGRRAVAELQRLI